MDLVREFELYWRASGKATVTFNTYRTYLTQYTKAGFELPPTLSDARQWISDCRDAGVKSQSILVRVRSIKAFAKFYGEQFDEVDQLGKLRFPKADESPPGVIADDHDIRKVLTSLKFDHSYRARRDAAIIALLRDTGCRRGELMRMALADVDLAHDCIVVPKTKAYRGRTLPLSSSARTLLLRYLKAREEHRAAHLPNLWLSDTRPIGLRDDSLTLIFERLNRANGTTLSAHQFRRRLAAVWSREGGTDDSLMALCGWTSALMPAKYRAAQRHELMLLQFNRIIDGKAV